MERGVVDHRVSTTPAPDFQWYSSESKRLGLTSPRCPFAQLHGCPKYYESRSLLGQAGSTALTPELEAQLDTKWKSHPLAPQEREQAPTTIGDGTNTTGFSNFCPEVLFERFGLFAAHLSRYTDELDRDEAHKALVDMDAPDDHPRWDWASFRPQHYSECPLYAPLSHDWPKHLAPTVPVSLPANARYDVFISHASEDKAFARQLAKKLEVLGLRAWFDEDAMKPGDSLRQEIDSGLAGSDFGVVVLSRHFFVKKWTVAELNGLFTLKLEGKNRIIPVWHEITKTEVANHSPMVADLIAIQASEGADSVAVKILKVVRPVAVEVFSASLSPGKAGTTPTEKSHGGKFSVELGKRHRHLREKVLQINPRRMADFYGFEKVAQLEACERGDDELPTAAVNKLCEFFFVNRAYLEEGSSEFFQAFDVMVSSDDCGRLLEQGFTPHLLIDERDLHDLYCYIVFEKAEAGFHRVIVSNTDGYLRSNGGGKQNIMHLILAMKRRGLLSRDAFIQKVGEGIWTRLEAKTYYASGDFVFHGPNHEARDIFDAWFEAGR